MTNIKLTVLTLKRCDMDKLSKARIMINEIDEKMAKLFCERMEAS